MTERMFIFGATGDLTARYLLPAIGALLEGKLLPDSFPITGIAHQEIDTASFREQIESALQQKAPEMASGLRRRVASLLEYRIADVRDPVEVRSAIGETNVPAVLYLALPPRFFAPTIRGFENGVLPAGRRIVVEKPFGEGLHSARELNALLHQTFSENDVFRLDHFLGRQTVQNLLGLRFANRVFEPLWSRAHIERVEIVWDETLALEGRSSYYDAAGALKDMVQNHLLQLLALVAMEPPLSLDEKDLRDRKTDLLRAVRRPTAEEVRRCTIRARYGAGRIGDRRVVAYRDEPGVDAERMTETFVEVILRIDNWRWAGVPFVLRSGKALGAERKEIAIHFQAVPHLAFGQQEQPWANVLRLQIDPDRMALTLNVNGIGDPFRLEQTELQTGFPPPDVPAYGRLLLDVFNGEPTFAIRDDEAEESWKIVEPILEEWGRGGVPLQEYAAGGAGPDVDPLLRECR
ncbi:MAG: glucose-6-phosphate dehydrogenase [Bryobacteraceae bacterium]|nr:glucose-6-phosphate dehydrogenase [Bryobacteraceae bacterium]